MEQQICLSSCLQVLKLLLPLDSLYQSLPALPLPSTSKASIASRSHSS